MPRPDRSDATPLTERESQIVLRVAQGFSNKEIAAQLDISVKTVETHKLRSMEKLGLQSRAEVVQFALRRGWLARRNERLPHARPRLASSRPADSPHSGNSLTRFRFSADPALPEILTHFSLLPDRPRLDLRPPIIDVGKNGGRSALPIGPVAPFRHQPARHDKSRRRDHGGHRRTLESSSGGRAHARQARTAD